MVPFKLHGGEEHKAEWPSELGSWPVIGSAGIAWWRSRRPRPVELLRRGDRGDVALLLVMLPEELQFLVAAGMLGVHASEQSGSPDELLGVRVEITSFTMQLEHHSFAGSPGMGSQGFGNSRLELMHLVAARLRDLNPVDGLRKDFGADDACFGVRIASEEPQLAQAENSATMR